MKHLILGLTLFGGLVSSDKTHNDPIHTLRFDFYLRCQELATRCKTPDKDCKGAIAQLKSWINEKDFELDEKKLLIKCIDQTYPENM